jgi:predicted ester cyclase
MATVLAVATFGAACKKKKTEGADQPAPKTNEPAATGSAPGSNNMAQGSDQMKPPETPKAVKKEGKDLAQAYLDCGKLMTAGKWDDFKKTCVADGFVSHKGDGLPDGTWEEEQKEMEGMRAAFPDMKMDPQVVIVSGRNVYGVSLMTATHTGPMEMPGMAPVPATNKKIGMLFFHKLALDDENKAKEEWAYMDPMTFMGQLGLTPKGAPPVRPVMEKGVDAPMIIVAADDEKEKKNVEAAQAATKAMESHKTADIVATYTDDAVESDQADAKDLKGKKEIQGGTDMFLKAFPDFKLAGDAQYVGAGDYVVLIGKFEGTNKGALGKMKATNKHVTGDFAEIIEMKDGKIAKLWRFRNGYAMAAQLGLVPMPGADAPKGDAPKGDKKDEPKMDEKAPATKDDGAKKSG